MNDSLQPTLFDALELRPMVQPVYAKAATIQERFEEFHKRNPQVYNAMRSLALGMKRRGFRRWSTKAVYEVMRWQYAMQTQGEAFKLSNDFTSRYARLLMAQEPELDGFFDTRELRGEDSGHD